MTDDALDRKPRKRADGCKVCHSAPCECAENRKAETWLREQGERAPLMTDGRLLGGNLERQDRGDPAAKARDFSDKIEERRLLAFYRDGLASRILDLTERRKADGAEILALERDFKVLAMFLDGRELDEIAAAFGRASHSWASERLEAIRADAFAGKRGEVKIPCGCGGLECFVKITETVGRPRRFRTRKCANVANDRKKKLRRLERRMIRLSFSDKFADVVSQSITRVPFLGQFCGSRAHGSDPIDARRIDQGGL